MPKRLYRVPAQYTTDPDVIPDRNTLRAIAKGASVEDRYAAFVEAQAVGQGVDPPDAEEYRLIAEIRDRKAGMSSEQSKLSALFQRLDNLYYPETVSEPGGADHWPEGRKPGRAHISVNAYPVYVDIPAALQSVTPVENYVPDSPEEDEREAAGRVERLYFGWKEEDEFELKMHKACVVKALYGFTYAKVYWDRVEKRPTVSVVDAPENLFVGWGSSQYDRMDWAIFCYGLTPESVAEEFGLKVGAYEGGDGKWYPYVTGDHADPVRSIRPDLDRRRLTPELELVNVYDYWYKKPKGVGQRAEVWNCIFVGNRMVKNERHSEYDDLPYVIIPNTYIPRSPYGRPELYDLEQLIREKDERLSENAQMIHSVVEGQMWQIVGPDAPDEVPPNAIPKPNKVASPGPGNELRAIQPFVPQFAVEEFIKRIDSEVELLSGLNDLLVGRAPATILGSSKAIAALVANYEARIRMRRDLLYQARKKVWKIAAKVWERKDKEVRDIIDGRYRLEVKPPELTPRDELETAQMAVNLVNARLWSMERAMDRTGVEDPMEEKTIIRDEQTDPTLQPAAVQAQTTLLAAMASLQAQGVQTPGAPTPEQTANNARQTQRTPGATESLNAPENAGVTPAESVPGNASPVLAQSMVQGGEASGRIIAQTEIGG